MRPSRSPHGLLRLRALAGAAGCLAVAAQAQGKSQTTEIEIREVLAIKGVTRGGRTPFQLDAVALARLEDPLPPAAGAELPTADGDTARWTALAANDSGEFSRDALRGGFASATVTVAEDRVMLLEATGHRHVTVNGVPRTGDAYRLGLGAAPVQLRAGPNELLFKPGRGNLAARLVAPPAPIFLEDRDRTMPDALGGHREPLPAAVVVTNATTAWQHGLAITAEVGGMRHTTALPALAPVSRRKVAIAIRVPERIDGADLELALTLRRGEKNLHASTLRLRARQPDAHHIRTFVSEIDGSVQHFGVTPAVADPDRDPAVRPGLVLSLHGAGVNGGNQAGHYRPKTWAHIVSPTNRRAFGFDWEDWGRLDALETLDVATRLYRPNPLRLYLTGHSMGGHGTWNLGAHFPDRFAAIGPSAGWRDFWSYGGAVTWDEPTPMQELFARAANASRTLLLRDNYRHTGVYVLHGDADRNVPVSQARFMRAQLAEFHSNFAYYERAGAGHWWGDQCMDWPPMFEFFANNVRAPADQQRRIQFATVNPGISAQCEWVTIEAQQRSLECSTVTANVDPAKTEVSASTTNVARLSLDLTPFAAPATASSRETEAKDKALATKLVLGSPLTLHIDDQRLEVAWPKDAKLRLRRNDDGWQPATPAPPQWKSPRRAGPFKDAFRHRMVFVVGTRGTPDENHWALAKARYDAETFWYRGNGSVDLVLDREFDPAADPDRNVILYGNATTNAAWEQVLVDAPIEMRAGLLRVGERKLKADDLAGLFVLPRRGSDVASVGVIGGTGPRGMRLTDQLPYFVSGVAYPDWLVFGREVLAHGVDGVRGAGFFGPDWSLGNGQACWQ
ncbi:MAG: prolyl oligopeptidase family serine peptidase [Planctomycetota bacterium]